MEPAGVSQSDINQHATPQSYERGRPPLADLFASLDRQQLYTLLLDLVERQPDLIDWIEGKVTLLVERAEMIATDASAQARPASTDTAVATPQPRPAPVDTAVIRKLARRLLRASDRERDYDGWSDEAEKIDIEPVLSQVTAFIAAGDSWNALAALEAITDECVDELPSLDEAEIEVETTFTSLGELWAEALLMADLTPDECEEWVDRLGGWQETAGGYSLGDGLEMAQAAAEQGWDYPPLQRVLQGEITDKGAWEDEAPSYANDLTVIRLAILARQKRFQEYLYLAEAEGQTDFYITMLVQAGRASEAVAYGLENFVTADAAKVLGQALQAQNLVADALRIGEHGLGLAGAKLTLARWLRDTAAGAGQSALALQAAVVAFREMPSLAEYKAVQAVAGEQWPSLRSDLIDHLRQTPTVWGSNSVDIFLYEGLIDDAIAIVDARSYYGNIVTVIDAAYRTHPDWAIGACRRWAEPIMDGNKAKHYDDAARWVEKIRTIYRAAGREAEWQVYLSELLGRHARQYKLVPMLQALRE